MTSPQILPLGQRASRQRSAFTLTELLVVVAIIGFLVALLVPSYQGVVNRAAETKCASNLRQLQAANISYANDHNGVFVAVSNASSVKWYSDPDFRDLLHLPLPPALSNVYFPISLMCPMAVKDGITKIGYGYNWTGMATSSAVANNPALSRSVRNTQLKAPSKTLAFIDGRDYQVNLGGSSIYDGRDIAGGSSDCAYRHTRGKDFYANVAFWDGHVEFLPRSAIDTQLSPAAAAALWTTF